jgi:pimeloyl-ACP methyl ester carboxylesterase
MRASWVSAAAALCLATAPAPAQRPVVFVHGLFMDASEWANSANYIKYNLGLVIDPIVPTLGWRHTYEDQAANLANAVAASSNVVAVSHSNGGIVTRQYGRNSGSGSHITGHIAVGSPHVGAPIVASVRNGSLGAYLDGLVHSLADPIS